MEASKSHKEGPAMPYRRPDEKALKRIVSEEYRRFVMEEAVHTIPQTIYERLCFAASRIIKIEPDKKSAAKLQEAIDFAHLHITPGQVFSLAIVFVIAVAIPTFVLMVTGALGTALAEEGKPPALPGIDLSMGLFTLLTMIPVAYYIYIYPLHLKKRYEMAVGSDMVSAILYMVVYMRNVPSLEGAVDFAARNTTGPLANELRKLMWDVRVGNFLSVEEALLDYAHKWKENKEFVESIELLISATKQAGARSLSMMDEAVRIILQGNRESSRHYVQNLKMPIAVIHAMGLILPVMGLVMFPIIAIFLSVSAGPLFLVYDVVLPLLIFFFMVRALEGRPATYSKIDVTGHPDIPPPGKFFVGKGKVRTATTAWPVGFAISAVLLLLGTLIFLVSAVCTTADGEQVCVDAVVLGTPEKPIVTLKIVSAMVVTLGLALGPAAYFLLVSKDSVSTRKSVRQIEVEFQEALFQLGNSVGGGRPIETAMTESMKRMEGMKIKDMFSRAAFNMQRFGMTFEQAFFDKKYGAITYYPSVLIKSVVKAVVESTKKGVRTAGTAMIAISKYLRGLHQTQEEVSASLSDVTHSLKFQAYALSPLISGIIATMAVIIIKILEELAEKTAAIGTAGAPGATGIGSIALISGKLVITPFEFIFVVSVFLIESLYLLSFLTSGIESGEDFIGRAQYTGYTLIVGTAAYILTLLGTLVTFAPLAVAVL